MHNVTTATEPVEINRRELLKGLAFGKIGSKKVKSWNPQMKWPDDMKDPEQNPHGRPVDYYCPTLNGQLVGWGGVYACETRAKAKELAQKFKDKCRENLEKVKINA